MLRKVMAVCVMVLLIGIGSAFGDQKPLQLSYPCKGGGTRTANGTYDNVTGDLSLIYVVTNCVVNNTTLNGGITTSGTVKLSQGTALDVDISSVYQETATHATHTASVSCTNATKGSYNISTEVLDGTITTNCTTSGTISITLNDLLLNDLSY